MQNERLMAIKMWEQIRDEVVPNNEDVWRFKAMYCGANDLKWQHDCWLCQHNRCIWEELSEKPLCPLGSCRLDRSAYQLAINRTASLRIRQFACNAIIAAIMETEDASCRESEVEDDRVAKEEVPDEGCEEIDR